MKTIRHITKVIWLSSLFALTCPVMGQVGQTPQLDIANDSLWSTLEHHDLSDKGNWVSYALSYESGHDTLFVRNTYSRKTFSFPKGYNGRFTKEENFSFLGENNTFQILNLKTHKLQKIDAIQQFDYGDDNKLLALLCTQGSKTKLEIRDRNLNLLKTVDSVSIYLLNPGKTALAYIAVQNDVSKVGYIDLKQGLQESIVITSSAETYQNLVWHKGGQLLVFVNQVPDAATYSTSLFFFDAKTRITKRFDIEKVPDWPKDMLIRSYITEALGVSDDGAAVYFRVKQKETKPKEENPVQVWNAADKDLYEHRRRSGDLTSQQRLAVWYPDSNKFAILSTASMPFATLLPNQKKVVLEDTSVYKPTNKHTADSDYYLLDVTTGEKTFLLKKHEGYGEYVEFSPNGNYIVYAKEGHWWLYDVTINSHRNLTYNAKTTFFDEDNDIVKAAAPYGIAGWTKDEKALLLYDKYDLWQLDLQNNSAKKLTGGREQGLIYRIEKQSAPAATAPFSEAVKTVNLEGELVMEALMVDFSKSGYFTFKKGMGVRPLVFDSKKINGLKNAKHCYLYLQQQYNEPPTIAIYSRSTGKATTIFQSNPQYQKYNWGKSELIAYSTANGNHLKGVLFYPFDYNPNKQYPMIVKIYERQLHTLHKFTNPSLLDGAGFNKTNHTSRGYFVLFPDITYEIGKPGFSAVDCVVAATKAAMGRASIHPKKIGLMGHSFGGYQTNFIITQTDLFAAAVSGSAVSDLTSCYLSIGWSYAKDNIWRSEQDQTRMGKSFFEDKEGFRNNSPIQHAEKVKTPLLSWTGEKDTQVNNYQSFEWYEALRRMKKEQVLLVYPNENHALVNENHQKDLSKRVMEWFDYYLGEGKSQGWMLPQ
ncbi:prolyl oligopeptidase family serine peptidase [Flavobacterium pedocola]